VKNGLANPGKRFTGKHVYNPAAADSRFHEDLAGIIGGDFPDYGRVAAEFIGPNHVPKY